MTDPSESTGRGGQFDDRTGGGRDSTTRRTFLRATAGASAVAVGAGVGLPGTAGAAGIPTPRLSRDGNVFRDPSGNRVVLRGVNVIDPARAVATAWRRSNTKTIEHATDASRDWYSRAIRVPIQPGDIVNDGKGYGSEPLPGEFDATKLQSYCETYLDPVVEKCAELGVYCIVDYHRHQDHDLEYTNSALDDEVTMFWETVAPRYAEYSNVVYEVYNEPISPFVGFRERNVNVGITDPGAEDTWLTWRDAAQPWVDTIQENAPQTPVLIGSPSWSQWTWWADEHEFDGDNLGYVGHVYAHPNLRPLGEYFGKPAENVPVFMTEFGWQPDGNKYFEGTVSEEGQGFVDFFEEYDTVSWTVWCFDHIWAPAMFDKNDDTKEWELLSGEQYHGKFFRDYLAEKRDADVPAGEGPGTPDPGTPDPGTPDPGTPDPGTPSPGETPPEWPDGTQPTDPNDDGVFENLNGNDRIDSDDVVVYFENYDQPYMADNAGFYDLNDNGRTDSDDVVVLFESL